MKGKKLYFISCIKGDGSGTTNVEKRDNSFLDEINFKVRYLSLSRKTLIAMEFNSYVVKLKKDM